MADSMAMAAQLAHNAARFGWYYGVNQVMELYARRIARRSGEPVQPRYRPVRPVPTERELMTELTKLLLADAEAVRRGTYPPMVEGVVSPAEHLARLRAMFRDVPHALQRRASRDAGTARQAAPSNGDLPEYFVQDFHFQAGGYLTEDSARLYDVQVETLFYGTAALMRRAALRPVATALGGRDQRGLSLTDVGCGTARHLRHVRLAYPALHLTGVDLSQAYLDEARRHLAGLRPVSLVAANAEALPLADTTQDVVTSIFLFHEVPPDVRGRIVQECARVLKPGGTLVVVDSLQMGDRPDWDGMLEAFPIRFHEPFFRQYAIDDLEARFRSAGLRPVETTLAVLSKVMVWRKPG